MISLWFYWTGVAVGVAVTVYLLSLPTEGAQAVMEAERAIHEGRKVRR